MNTENVEWLNENSFRRYPVREDCSMIPCDPKGNPTDASFALPTYVIVDFMARVPTAVGYDIYLDVPKLYIRKITLTSSTLYIGISAEEYDKEKIMASVTIDLNSHEPNTAYTLSTNLRAHWGAVTAIIVIGDLTNLLDDLPTGNYSYTPDQASFETTCTRLCRVGLSSLRAFSRGSGYGNDKVLVGDVTLVAGNNLKFTRIAETGEVTLDSTVAGSGASAIVQRLNGMAISGTATINNQQTSNIQIVGSDGIKVDTSGGVITIKDTNAVPCCGCAELSAVTMRMSEVTTAVSRLSNYMNTLSDRLTEYSSAKALRLALGRSTDQ